MKSISHIAIATALAGFPAHTAISQTAANDDLAATGGPIVVTAQKREEAITDVPLTVTAYSGEQLEAIGIDEFDELSAYVPGLNIQEQSANNPGFVIRGITSDSGSAQIAPRVTIYYNGIDVSRSRGSYFDLFDIDRIEVVKGPQATLFGTAATIGAISVITNRPTPDESASLSASYGNFNAVDVTGAINGGTEDIAGRLAFVYKRRDGYIDNIAGDPGAAATAITGVDQSDLNGIEQYGVRGSLRIFPTDDSTIDLIVTYEEQRNSGTAFKSGTIAPTGGDTSPFTFAELGGSPVSGPVLGIDELGLERQVFDANVTFETPVSDNFTLTSITGYRHFDSLETFDADGTALFYLEFAEDARGEQMSHETRLSYDSDMFRGFAGFNIFHEEGTQRVPFSTDEGTYLACAPFAPFAGVQALLSQAQGGAPACVGPNGELNALNATAILTQGAATVLPYASVFENGGDNSAYSAFADATLDLGNLELTAGLRYVIEERQSSYSATQPSSVIAGAPLLGAANTGGGTFFASDDFDAFLPRFNALYRFNDDINIYATVSKGRRAPVLDLDAANTANGVMRDLTLVPAEQVWNYEGGIKADIDGFFGAIGVFYQDYSNFQTSVIESGTGQIVPVNAGQASNFGVEIEAVYRFAPWLRAFANYAYIDAEIDTPADGGATQFVGSRFRLQPKHSASGGLQINAPVADDIEFFLTPTVTYQSRVFFEVPNNPLLSEDGYTLVNVRGGFSFGEGRYQISGFARNLFDENYLIDAGNTGGGFGTPTFIAGEPALYGVEVAVRF